MRPISLSQKVLDIFVADIWLGFNDHHIQIATVITVVAYFHGILWQGWSWRNTTQHVAPLHVPPYGWFRGRAANQA